MSGTLLKLRQTGVPDGVDAGFDPGRAEYYHLRALHDLLEESCPG